MSRALVLAAGDPPPDDFVRSLEADLVICADGGLALARRAGLRPDAVVGDLDSAAPEDLEDLAGVAVLRHPPDKDESDLELALLEARRRGAREAVVAGALGGRLGHQVVNLLGLLPRAAELGLEVRLVAPGLEVFLAGRGSHALRGRLGWPCTLAPITETATLTLRGLRYGLESQVLRRASTRGLSNEVTDEEALLQVEEGQVLVVLGGG